MDSKRFAILANGPSLATSLVTRVVADLRSHGFEVESFEDVPSLKVAVAMQQIPDAVVVCLLEGTPWPTAQLKEFWDSLERLPTVAMLVKDAVPASFAFLDPRLVIRQGESHLPLMSLVDSAGFGFAMEEASVIPNLSLDSHEPVVDDSGLSLSAVSLPAVETNELGVSSSFMSSGPSDGGAVSISLHSSTKSEYKGIGDLGELDQVMSLSTLPDEPNFASSSLSFSGLEEKDLMAVVDQSPSMPVSSLSPSEPEIDLGADVLSLSVGDSVAAPASINLQAGQSASQTKVDPDWNLDDDVAKIHVPVDTNAANPLAGQSKYLGVDSLIDDSQSSSPSPSSWAALDGPSIAEAHIDDFPAHASSGAASSGSPAASSEEVQTLRKYAALKEREVREKDSSLQIIRGQLEQLQKKYTRSEDERRRVLMNLQDLETVKRTLESSVDQNKHNIEKLETIHHEEIRALQLRLDNAQFLAQKSERKLDEFRERVKEDILKIRLHERELANKLDLQKRDAEALLAAKDERLLQQKREIDRLEFEISNLKERLVDETQRSEERVGRLMRAVQSLKLAQGLLESMEEEVLPNSGNGGREAA